MSFSVFLKKIFHIINEKKSKNAILIANREIEIALNRTYFCIIFGIIFYNPSIFGINFTDTLVNNLKKIDFFYFITSILFLLHLLFFAAPSISRKIIGILVDTAAITGCLAVGGEYFTIGYTLYLWVIFGNGLRFGNSYLMLAMVTSLIGSAYAISANAFWSAHPYVVGGLLSGLIMLPIYAFRLVKKLSAALAAAEEANRAKTLFIASVSHELRTPLTSIIGLGELLQNTNLSADQDNMVRTISSAGRSLLRMINSILNIAKAEDNHRGILSEKIDIYQLLSDIRAMLSVQATAKETRLVVEISPSMPQFIQGNFRHLEEILLNLIGNAVKFTARGSVRVLINARPVAEGRLRLRCDIYDTGIGIAEEHQIRIFQRFTQANDSILTQFGGSGLGLAIARQLVELYNGTIGVNSALDQGSHFWFEIDAATVQDGQARFDQLPSTEILYPDVVQHIAAKHAFRILVAEDNITNQKIISKILTLAGHDVKAVENGEQALDALLYDSFDIALMDINMPVMSGLEATQLYHFSATGEALTPIVALTADMSEQTRQNCLQAGIRAFCTKPIDTEHLLAILQQVVQTYPVQKRVKSQDAARSKPVSPTQQKVYFDPAPLANLTRLGGEDFCDDIIAEFLSESGTLAHSIQQAISQNDLPEFNACCHALQSCAGNIGAKHLVDLLLQWQTMSASELQQHGPDLCQQIQQEMNTIRNILVNRTTRTDQAIAI